MRDSDDVKTKLLAERWYGAIKQQEWTDATGKFKTSAKYVAHDPQLAWVKIRMIQGVGKKRVVKDMQIPLEKLSVACQARVKQIAQAHRQDRRGRRGGKEEGSRRRVPRYERSRRRGAG